jgi:ATP-dependent RNA helicase RhlE
MLMSFTAYGLSDILALPLARLGYARPTPIQSQSIPIVLSGSDLLARARTGTGKTAAFGLPMIDRLLVRSRLRATRAPRGLVVVPTRELAVQVHRALATYGAPVRLRVGAIVGGVSMQPQIAALRRGVDIVVATPGRLIDHLERRTIDLSGIEILTLDEADRLLDMGFLPSLRRVLEALPRTRQTLLFSATISAEVKRLAEAFTREAQDVDVTDGEAVPSRVTHRIHLLGDGPKTQVLTQVLQDAPAERALVFCKTKRRSDRVGEHVTRSGIAAAVIHGNKSQGARNRALEDFKQGRVRVLVATDIAARGLDIDQLPLVINYDLPVVAEDYVHRVGRTGRAGRAGRAVSLVAPEERGLLPAIQRLVSFEPDAIVGDAHPPVDRPTPQPRHARAGFRQSGRPRGRLAAVRSQGVGARRHDEADEHRRRRASA